MATIWDGDSWATNGGKTKIIWAHAPFISHFRGFAIDGCPYDSSHRKSCNSSKFWWNGKNYWQLSPDQERRHQVIKRNYMPRSFRKLHNQDRLSKTCISVGVFGWPN
ncbi:hypothetical protein ACSBR2_030567 [Camellia fascicularis]